VRGLGGTVLGHDLAGAVELVVAVDPLPHSVGPGEIIGPHILGIALLGRFRFLVALVASAAHVLAVVAQPPLPHHATCFRLPTQEAERRTAQQDGEQGS